MWLISVVTVALITQTTAWIVSMTAVMLIVIINIWFVLFHPHHHHRQHLHRYTSSSSNSNNNNLHLHGRSNKKSNNTQNLGCHRPCMKLSLVQIQCKVCMLNFHFISPMAVCCKLHHNNTCVFTWHLEKSQTLHVRPPSCYSNFWLIMTNMVITAP